MASHSVPKNRTKSAAAPIAEQLEDQIREALRAIPLPPHPFIEPGIAETTLDNVGRLLDVLNVMAVREGYDMPEGGELDLLGLRASLIAAVKYAHDLVDTEDEMRGAARRQALEVSSHA